MEEDQVIGAMGPWGPWQRYHVLLVGMITMLASWPSLIITYTAAPSEKWCARPEEYMNMSVEAWRELSSPEVMEGGKLVRDPCHVWAELVPADSDPDYKVAAVVASVNGEGEEDLGFASDLGEKGGRRRPRRPRDTVPCSSWEHDRSAFSRTAVQQWDLVCERENYLNLAQSSFFAGMLVGTLAVGLIGDRYGRRFTLIPCCLLTVAVGVLLPFSPGVEAFIALRFLHGIFKYGLFVTAFIWSMEVVGGEWHTYVGMGMQFPWVTAWMILCGLGWVFKGDWHLIQWATSVPGVLTVALWWILPESPKWLLAAGRITEAEDVVRKAADRNGKTLAENWKLQPLNLNNNRLHERPPGRICDIFCSGSDGSGGGGRRNLIVWTLVIYLNWFANSFVYYGLTLNSGSIGGSYQWNFFINGILEIPAYSITLYVLLKCGRRLPYVAFLVTGALCLMSTAAFESGSPFVVALAMAGKFCVTGTFGIVYVYSAEIFPTVVRSAGIGTASVFARVGGAVAPYVGALAKVYNPTVPVALFGVTALIAGATALMLPETRNTKMPDTMDEGNRKKLEEVVVVVAKEEGKEEEEALEGEGDKMEV